MKEKLLPGNPPIALKLRRSANARRISLRVSQLDGRVTLTLPLRVSEAEAVSFAREKETWIRGHLAARPEEVRIAVGAVLPIAGMPHEVTRAPGRRIILEPGRVGVPGPEERIGARLAAHLRQMARARVAEASDRYAAKLGRSYAAITLRDTRSRWGSCTSEGRLMYSWRLVLAPPDVLDYVAAHEVAHLKHLDHSSAFWAEVARLYGDFKAPRAWLRREGSGLHRYRFEAD